MSAVNELVITPEFVTNIIAVDLADETTFTTADKAKLNGIEAGAQVNTVTRVAGKTGVVELDAGDIAYDASETYESGKIGAALKSAEEKLNTINAGDIGYDGSTAYDTGTVGEELTHLNRQISESITPAIEEIETALDGKAPVIINTASGDIASFEDGADGMPVKSLVANIEPVQDLHGYDYPWPGGCSKNKLDLVAVFNGSGSYSADGSVYTLDSITERPLVQFAETDGNYILTWDNTANSGTATNVRLEFYNSAGTLVTSRYCTEVTPYALNGVCKVKANYSNNGTLSIKNPMIRLATETDATFAPYSNICPISGHTGAEVTRTGKNLVNVNSSEITGAYIDAAGEIHASTTWSVSDFVPVMVGKNYILSGLTSHPNTGVDNFIFYDSGKNKVSKTSQNALTSFTIQSGVDYVKFSWKNTEKDTVMFEQSSTASAYEPFGTTPSITFPSEAGTVYGGTLDVTNGVLTVDRAMVTVDGSQVSIANLSNTGVFSTYETVLAGLPTDKIEMYVSSRFKAHINSGISYMDNEFTVDGNKRIMIKAPNLFSTVNEANAYFVENPTQFVGLIQNPITYQLTPQELDTLLGTNNIWTDVGTVDVEYPADTRLFIEQLTKPTEDDMTADHAIASGTFFMIGNNLYLATSQIAAGGTITPGTNAAQLSLADALNQLNT